MCSCLVNRLQGKIVIKIANKAFENVIQSRYLGTKVTNLNCFKEEIKSRLSSGNAVQSGLSSHMLFKTYRLKYTRP
jgi:ribosomal protein S2